MGTTQSLDIDDTNFSSAKQNRNNAKIEAQRIATYNEKVRRGRQGGSKAKRNHTPKQDAIAIAELMKYLKDVAAHASNLPLTTRDDPELGRTVSSLTAKEYAKKAEVFIPSDVRVIGGTSLKYHSQREYPNKRNLNLSARVTEFTRSHGGACCSAMLKVLYDNGTEDADIMADHDLYNTDNLFDESDDEDDDEDDADDGSVASIVFDDVDIQSESTLTWALLLRKMKDEMKELGHKQVPTISTSRRFELNDTFSLLPASFDPKTNKKMALLIGCNYPKKSGAITTSHDNVRSLKDYIVNIYGFSDSKDSLTVLIDDGQHTPPTHSNILREFDNIARRSKQGDAVLVQFVGHGTRILDTSVGAEADCYDEVILPCDFEKAGLIRDTTIFKALIAPMAKDVTVTILLDSIDTGVMFDMPYSWSTINDNRDTLAKLSLNDTFSFVRFLKVLKQMYESSTHNAENPSESEEIGYDSDSVDNESLCTDEGEDEDDDDEGNYDSDDDQNEDDINVITSKDNRSLDSKFDNNMDEYEAKKEEAVMTTIGEYFKPSSGQPGKTGSMKPRSGLQKKVDLMENQVDSRDNSSSSRGGGGGGDGGFFSGSGFARNLTAQNLYSQVSSLLTQTNGQRDGEARNRKIVTQPSASIYDEETNYFVQDSESDYDVLSTGSDVDYS